MPLSRHSSRPLANQARRLFKAKSVIARTVFQELKRAQYSDSDIVEFVNKVLELLMTDDLDEPSRSQPPIDAECGLLTHEVLCEVLEHEREQSLAHGRPVSVLVVELEIPDWLPHGPRAAVLQALTAALARDVRNSDAAGKVESGRFALILPTANRTVAAQVAHRVASFVAKRYRASFGISFLTDIQVVFRCASNEELDVGGEASLRACRESEPVVRVSLSETRGPGGTSDIEPLHPAKRDRVVLALGGGAARAAAHAGVLRYLDQNEIKVSGIAGTSAGAIVACMHAMGLRSSEILQRFADFPSSHLYRRMRRAYVVNRNRGRRNNDPLFRATSLPFLSDERVSVLPDEALQEFVAFFVGPDRDLSGLSVPVACTASDLESGQTVALRHGSMHDALRASCAVPGLFPPQKLNGHTLIDGSLLCEVPVHVAEHLHAGPVLGVYLERPAASYVEPSNSLEIAVRSLALVHTELLEEQLSRAEMILSIPVGRMRWLDFGSAEELAAEGEKAAAALCLTPALPRAG